MNRFFESEGMMQTTTTTKTRGNSKAKGYNYYNQASGISTEAKDFIALRPSGAFSSSMTDMIKWDSIQLETNLLTKEDWRKMREDTVKAGKGVKGVTAYYGYGWFLQPYKQHGLVHHGGNTPGFTSEYWKMPDDHLSIIILTNANEINANDIAKNIHKVIY